MASAPASAERSLSTCPVPPEALAVAAFIRSAPVFALITLSRFGRGQADHQWPAQALGEEEGQHPGAFPGFRLAAGEHQLRARVAQVLGQCGQGVGAGRLFQHGQAFQAHAEIAAQRLGVRVAGVQHL